VRIAVSWCEYLSRNELPMIRTSLPAMSRQPTVAFTGPEELATAPSVDEWSLKRGMAEPRKKDRAWRCRDQAPLAYPTTPAVVDLGAPSSSGHAPYRANEKTVARLCRSLWWLAGRRTVGRSPGLDDAGVKVISSVLRVMAEPAAVPRSTPMRAEQMWATGCRCHWVLVSGRGGW
jgi:hypothetical protein